MKFFTSLFLISSVFALWSCATTSSTSSENRPNRSSSQVIVDNPNLGLDVYINRLNGVRVQGTGQNATVIVRGASSTTIMSDPRPIFIVDGVNMGRDFSRIYRAVDMNKVNSIGVIQSSRATILYGHEGSNGAIEIRTEI
ncbi:MAG: hypothetical protein EA359_14705 [Balneolaceae bacterium]|nr:MAG: hypothetical protein EA359_14705 [Balneolaceae bacterium]